MRCPVIGLTGAPGAGKTTAATVFGTLRCVVLDVDRMGHEALDTPGVRAAVAKAFGSACLGPGARIDRARLAARVFGDPEALARLESIVHPSVRRRVVREIAAARAAAPRAIVVDCALLFEGRLDRLCDTTVAVVATVAERRRRVAARGWSPADLRRREASQMSAATKRARAAHTIRNDGPPAALAAAVAALLGRIAPDGRIAKGGRGAQGTGGTRGREQARRGGRRVRRPNGAEERTSVRRDRLARRGGSGRAER